MVILRNRKKKVREVGSLTFLIASVFFIEVKIGAKYFLEKFKLDCLGQGWSFLYSFK